MSEPIRAVTFLCPVFVTGGTEAIHQAAAAMRREGLPADIAYYDGLTRYGRDGEMIRRLDEGGDNACQTAFAAYEPRVAREIRLAPDHLVVAPELSVMDAETYRPARFAVWWLSINNAFNHVPQLVDPAVRERVFAQKDVLHFYQSQYARRFLVESGACSIHQLTDITHRSFLEPGPSAAGRGAGVMFNRKKGFDLAQSFFAGSPDLASHALDGLSMAELRTEYRAHTVYVDFGILPGKDRMPREAAASGCVVFVHSSGAGREMGDFPLRGFYKFGGEDVASGRLAERIRAVLADPAPHLEAQRHFRDGIAAEEAVFADDVRGIVAELRTPGPASPAAASGRGSAPPAPFGTWAEHADRHCIWIVSPKGYDHHRAFDEAALALSRAFAERGGSAPVVRHPSEWAGRVPIVLGAHLLTPTLAMVLPGDAVLYNMEQVDRASSWLDERYLGLMRRHRLLDYSAVNTAALKRAGFGHARHLAPGYVPELTRVAPAETQDIDVLFYGSLNERRAALLDRLRAAGLAVTHLFNVYGDERDAAVARARIVLNLHHYEAAVFESVRVGYLLANRACVVTEGDLADPDLAPYLGGLAVCGYDEIVPLCLALVGDEGTRRALGERGLAVARRNRQADSLGALFAPA